MRPLGASRLESGVVRGENHRIPECEVDIFVGGPASCINLKSVRVRARIGVVHVVMGCHPQAVEAIAGEIAAIGDDLKYIGIRSLSIEPHHLGQLNVRDEAATRLRMQGGISVHLRPREGAAVAVDPIKTPAAEPGKADTLDPGELVTVLDLDATVAIPRTNRHTPGPCRGTTIDDDRGRA